MFRTIILILISSLTIHAAAILKYVDPIIGTGAADTPSAEKHGSGSESFAQTFPAVGKPFAMTFWTPETRPTEKKCVSPYYYSDTHITGFRGSHWLSGSCVQDYGTFTLMPISGELVCLPEDRASKFQHSNEKSSPVSYSVLLDDYNIDVNMTATDRAGLFQFTFGEEDNYLIINANSERGESFMEILPEKNEIVGYNPVHRIYQGWGEPAGFSGYVVIQFQQPFTAYGTFAGVNTFRGRNQIELQPESGVFVKFAKNEKSVQVKIGTSFTSIEQTRKNVNTEIPHWDFARVVQETETAWQDMLSRLEVEGGTPEELTKYYTAAYHCMLAPHKFSDVDGSYIGFAKNNEIHKAEGFTYYTDFSMWDIFRAELPLINMIAPELSLDFIKSITAMAEQGGWMPIFPMWNHYTSAMIGDHIVAFIADAWAKGIRDFDLHKLYPYLRQNAFESPKNFQDYVDGKGRRALPSYLKFGYIPMEDQVNEAFHKNEQVSRTLEYAYNDFCLAQLAKALGKTEDYEILMKRSENWRNVFDPQVNWVRGKHENGDWVKEFKSDEKQIYITEGTPRHYTWFVPHNIPGLIDAMGTDAFERQLDDMFAGNYYWHGNEPGHQIPFLYTFIDKPEKTRVVVEKIMNEKYGLGPGGLSGNDDAGQMSAWYVFAAIGKYPVCPGVNVFGEFEAFLRLK